jgi:hypothetical protein
MNEYTGLISVLNMCIARWRETGVALSPPVEEAEVRRVLHGYGKRASEDVILLYGTVGGFKEYETDNDESLWTFWPWKMVEERNTAYQGDGVMFCDHSLQVVIWELRFEEEGRSSVWQVDSPCPVMTAPSIEAFFRLYLQDPLRLL